MEFTKIIVLCFWYELFYADIGSVYSQVDRLQ